MNAAPRLALLTGDRCDCTLELFAWLQPGRLAEARAAGVPSILPSPLYALPVQTEGPAVLLGSTWALAAQAAGVDVPGRVLPALRARFDRVVGFDQEATFHLHFPDEIAAGLDLVIKPAGVFRDPGLYDFEVGAWTPDGTWTEKIRPRTDARLDLRRPPLHAGVPVFVTEAPGMRALRRRMRTGLLGGAARAGVDALLASVTRPMQAHRPPPYTVHALGALTHVQRADALRRIRRAGIRCFGGITDVVGRVNGFEGKRNGETTGTGRRAWMAQLSAEGLTARRLPLWAFRASLLRCKAVLSIAGHGEMCFRMAQAWAARRILVCQDLSHAHTGFPFVNGRNVVYCRPDLADLTDILDDIEINFPRYLPIAEQGHADWLAWAAGAAEHLHAQFAPAFAVP